MITREDITNLIKEKFKSELKEYEKKEVLDVRVSFKEEYDYDDCYSFETLKVYIKIKTGKSFRWVKYYF